MPPFKGDVKEHTLELYGQLEPNIFQLYFNLKFLCFMLWVNLWPNKWYLEVLSPVPVNVTLCGSKIFADIIKWRWGYTELESVLNQYDLCPHKRHGVENTMRRYRDTEGREPCEDGSRDWIYDAKSQDTAGATISWKRQGRSTLRGFRGRMTLPKPGFWNSSILNCETMYFYCFKRCISS